MEKLMTKVILKVESYCAYLSVCGPNMFVCKNALKFQGWLHQKFPKLFPESPYNMSIVWEYDEG